MTYVDDSRVYFRAERNVSSRHDFGVPNSYLGRASGMDPCLVILALDPRSTSRGSFRSFQFYLSSTDASYLRSQEFETGIRFFTSGFPLSFVNKILSQKSWFFFFYLISKATKFHEIKNGGRGEILEKGISKQVAKDWFTRTSTYLLSFLSR